MTTPADIAMTRAEEALGAFDVEGCVVHLSAAIRELTAVGAVRPAAMACARLGDVYHSLLGNKVAARPWFNRAIRLLADEEPCVEQGWVAVATIGCDVDDPAVLRARADLALDRARRFGDADLEIKALADGGLARVEEGDVDEGMAMLDEAMALACGAETSDATAVGKSVCSFYTACTQTADFDRFESWTQLFRRRGLLGTTPGPAAFLSSHCDSVAGLLLCHVGRWTEAERVLVAAYEAIEAAMPGAAWHPPIALAELRILQGRLDEAEVLLLGKDDQIQALLPLARLHLARGDADLARAAGRRGLRVVGGDRVRAAMLLAVLVEAELALGAPDRAAEAAAELQRRAAGIALPALRADAARATAQVLAATGDTAGAVTALRDALDDLAGRDLPCARLRVHVELARLLEHEDRAEARVEAAAAIALLAKLDIVVPTDVADLLGRLGPAAAGGGRRRSARLAPAGGAWSAVADGVTVRLRDTKGIRYLADLVAHPGVERHCLDLVDAVEGVDAGVDRRQLGDAGPLLDAQARAVCRRRLAVLRNEVEDALAVEDDDRAARTQAELDAVVAELARAFGLGGRERRAASTVERARLNVTRAIRTAIAAVTDALPDAGTVLDRRVRTGIYCAYEPAVDDPVVWTTGGSTP